METDQLPEGVTIDESGIHVFSANPTTMSTEQQAARNDRLAAATETEFQKIFDEATNGDPNKTQFWINAIKPEPGQKPSSRYETLVELRKKQLARNNPPKPKV